MAFGWDDAIGIFSAASSFLGGERRNESQERMYQQSMAQNDFQFRNKYQVGTQDLMNAGLNPMLAYMNGGATPTGSVSPPQLENAAASGAQSGATTRIASAQAALLSAQTEKVAAEKENIAADTKLKLEGQIPELRQRAETSQYSAANLNAQTGLFNWQAKRITDEIEKLRAEKANIQSNTAQREFDVKHILPLEVKLMQLKTVADQLDIDIKKPEAAWAKRTGEFRPAAKDIAGVAGNLGSVTRGLRPVTINRGPTNVYRRD